MVSFAKEINRYLDQDRREELGCGAKSFGQPGREGSPRSCYSTVRRPLRWDELGWSFLERNTRCKDPKTGRSLMRNRTCDLRWGWGVGVEKEGRRR